MRFIQNYINSGNACMPAYTTKLEALMRQTFNSINQLSNRNQRPGGLFWGNTRIDIRKHFLEFSRSFLQMHYLEAGLSIKPWATRQTKFLRHTKPFSCLQRRHKMGRCPLRIESKAGAVVGESVAAQTARRGIGTPFVVPNN